MAVFLFLTAAVVVTATAAPERRQIPSREQLLQMLSPENRAPEGVPADFECGWRALAFEYAKQLQPSRPPAAFQDIHDALELTTMCKQPFNSNVSDKNNGTKPHLDAAATSMYVDAVSGKDTNSGSEAAPLRTIAAAVTAVRTKPHPAAVILRGSGVHR